MCEKHCACLCLLSWTFLEKRKMTLLRSTPTDHQDFFLFTHLHVVPPRHCVSRVVHQRGLLRRFCRNLVKLAPHDFSSFINDGYSPFATHESNPFLRIINTRTALLVNNSIVVTQNPKSSILWFLVHQNYLQSCSLCGVHNHFPIFLVTRKPRPDNFPQTVLIGGKISRSGCQFSFNLYLCSCQSQRFLRNWSKFPQLPHSFS